jgi:L-threonylcarbamoyladenylate synthase
VNDIDTAVRVLRAGGLVAIPTETVYGLAADAANTDAVRRIFAVKARPADHPLIVHLAAAEQLGEWATAIPRTAAILADACWPGPLTLLVPRANHVLDVVTGGRSTLGVRVPAHPLTLELLARFGGGLAAPSANRFGKVSPTTADHVRADLGGDVDFVLDGGPCPIGVESTIVDCTVEPPQVLRPGGIPTEHIAALLNSSLDPEAGPSRAPGMLESHYAPRCRLLLVATPDEAQRLTHDRPTAEILDDEDLARYARSLYSRLRDADDRGVDTVIAVMPPALGLGHAIRDRLTKAASTPGDER